MKKISKKDKKYIDNIQKRLYIYRTRITNHRKTIIMTEEKQIPIQVKIPGEMSPLFEDLREVRSANFEPTSNLSIVIDAVKSFHKQKVRK